MGEIFTEAFLANVQELIERHHTIYPHLPPQGVFFEVLVEQGFRLSGWTAEQIVPSSPNSPWHDLLVGSAKLSIKSETGKITRPDRISITKLCTTETGEWTTQALLRHTLAHLGRHDRMLMVRAIWVEGGFDYQLLEIPIPLLEMMAKATFVEVGSRKGRRSLGADVMDGGEKVFHVHFDGADGKCQVQQLLRGRCHTLREWHQVSK